MPEIPASLVQELREATNLGMMQCKQALVDAGGDKEKAIRLLRERGMAIAQKKASRAANQGLVASVIRDGGKVGSLIEVNCETDFVSRNATFVSFVNGLALKACETDQSLADTEKATLTARIAEIGENLVIRKNTRYVLQGAGAVTSYIHHGGKVGVLLEIACEKPETATNVAFSALAKDIAMHIAASKPAYLDAEAVPGEVVAAEREIYAKQMESKPANVIQKIVDGKMKKFYADVCLLDQPFVKQADQAVRALLAETSKLLGESVSVRRFVRYQVGV